MDLMNKMSAADSLRAVGVHTKLVRSPVVVGYQWFEVRVFWDRNLSISLCKCEQLL